MSIQPYILNDIGIRSINDTIGELQKLFNEVTQSHIPVGKDGVYIGCISGTDARSFEKEKNLGEYQFALESFFVRENENWLDVLEAFAVNETDLLPVLDEENSYLGYVELFDVVNLLTETPFLNGPGGILILEKGYRDYSFSEISQIVESNDAHILGMFVSKIENDVAQIVLKINQNELNAILQSFRRYGYNIVSQHQEDSFHSSLRERSKYLDKYLNI